MASDKVLEIFCQLHRLLLALRNQYPSLKSTIHQRLHTFAKNPESRVKSQCANLGQLLPLLAVSDTYTFGHLATAYLQEAFDRSVLWACMADSSLAKVEQGDESRLQRFLDATAVSQRVTMLNVFLVRLLRPDRQPLDQTMDSHDVCLGRPPLFMCKQWHQGVQAIRDASTWPKVFSVLGVPLPPKAAFLGILETAVKNSLSKGYHDHNTRFERIHRSGVSHLLLKGESYSCAPNLKRVRLTDRWKLSGPVNFLDASCFIYVGDKRVGTVDYQSTTWGADFGATIKPIGNSRRIFELHNSSTDSVVHSGDQIDHANNIGEHTIDVDLQRLPHAVTGLVFTISSWQGTLSDAVQPMCILSDAGSPARTELCSYELEAEIVKNGAKNTSAEPTAAIMCTLTRASAGSARWSMKAIGHQGQGRATGMHPGYGPMFADIRDHDILETRGSTNATGR